MPRTEVAVPVEIQPHGTRSPGSAYRTACAAPAIQLRFDPNGLVTSCCKSLQPLGHIGRQRLTEIWNGASRRKVEAALEVDDFSVGCQRCEAEIAQEGRAVSYAAIHDEWAGHLTHDPASRAWPVRMELNLSNACNLQCVQCDGESSSAIRLHREKLPPLPRVYGNQFFEDLVEFLPHLERMVFAGGEPFMSSENARIWDLLRTHSPQVECVIVTNATQWSPRVREQIRDLDVSFIISLDGITKATYESIRVGADFDAVMANVAEIRRYAAERGASVSVNHCLMPQNAHEFGALLRWAEEREIFVNVSVVRSPAHSSIAALPADRIGAIAAAMAAQDEDVRASLGLNLATWEGELRRVSLWAEGSGADGGSEVSTVLWFRCAGEGPFDPRPAMEELSQYAADGVLHEFRVDASGIIVSAQSPLADASGGLIGSSVRDLTQVVTARMGTMNFYEVVSTGDSRVDAIAEFSGVPARFTTVAERDADGWAEHARILLAFGEPNEA